jgi:5,8-dihydroxy-2-naphthoate synthase
MADGGPYDLAYSPCPNDTYVFAALTNGLLDDAPPVRATLEDIDALNASAERGRYELTKISYGVVPLVTQRYRLLRSGGALGRGCGPLLVARSSAALSDFTNRLIAIPGEQTTAFALLRLALGARPPTARMRYDRIIEAVQQGTVDAGLIIHESRFTYAAGGLVAIADLGAWWETETGLPIPLGVVAARDDIADDDARELNHAIRRSLTFARANPQEVMPYVREHATEMSEDVMLKHIALYVNEFTDDIGDEGMSAVREFFARTEAAGVLPAGVEARFV